MFKTSKKIKKIVVLAFAAALIFSSCSVESKGSDSEPESVSDTDDSKTGEEDSEKNESEKSIKLGDLPVGFASVSVQGGEGTIVTSRAELLSAVSKGGLIYVKGTIDMSDGMLPDKAGGSTNALDSFVAEKSDNQNIKIGETLVCGTENLFLYPSEGNDIYRLGTYALMDEKEKQIQVMIAENKKQILCNVSNNYLWTNNITAYKEIETEDSLYIYIPTLMDLANNDNRKKIMDEHFENLQSVSARYPEKKNIIIDLRTNGGGNSRHTSKFLANLYFLEKNCNEKTSNKNMKKEWSLIGCNGDKIDMISPSVFQAEQWMSKNVFSQDKFWLNEIKKRSKILDNRNLRIKYSEQKVVMAKSGSPKFKGKMIILTGKNTCSSGELAILEAKIIFSKTNQFFQIGENSGGCYAYGNVWCYQLINSGIALHLACFRSPFSENCPEGLGFIPGYWATNDDILKAIVNVTGDEELSEKLVEINSDL